MLKTLVLLLTCTIAFGQKIHYSVINNTVKIQGVDGTNRVVLDNDFFGDSPDGWYIWLKANRNEVNLVGNIATKCGHPTCESHDDTYRGWIDAYNAANSTGLKNIPQPIKGSSQNYNGTREESEGSNLIIAEARKASPQKPLVIFVGGQVTTVANAWLKDNSIGPNIIVFHVDGLGSTDYNAIDGQSVEICINNMRYINWDGDLNGWYDGAGYYGAANANGRPVNRMPGVTLNTPNNPFASLYKSNNTQPYHYYGSVGDAPPVLYFFNNSLWMDVVKKNKANQTVKGDKFDFLLVSKNKWADYGPMLSGYMNDATNYIPVTTTPDVNTHSSTQLKKNTTNLNEVQAPSTANTNIDVTVPVVTGTVAVGATTADQQGQPANVVGMPPPTGPAAKGYYDITNYGAKGDGITDDRAAIQAAIDDAIRNKGTIYAPAPANFYNFKGTLFIQGKGSINQTFLDFVGQGHYGFQFVYNGPSGQPAVVIIGLKTGNIHRMHVKLGPGVSNSVAYEIDTNTISGSTSAFTFEDCSAELGLGENNIGWRLGKLSLGGGDISQIQWDNCTVWGTNQGYVNGLPKLVKGQIGWLNDGGNTLQLTWTAGGYSFVETAVKATKSGAMYFFGFGGSQAKLDFDIHNSNNFGVWGGRFEAGQKFLNVEQSANAPIFTISNTIISEYKPTDGIIFHFKSPGSLKIEDAAIIRQNTNYDSRMITLSTPSDKPFGTFSISRGSLNASDPFITSNGWRVKVDNVIKLKTGNFQSIGYFTNK